MTPKDIKAMRTRVEKSRTKQMRSNEYVDNSKKQVGFDPFLRSAAWRKVRMKAFVRYGNACLCCGATPADGAKINMDHIKPRKLFPQLALKISNLQPLCAPCNQGKGNWDQTDWRAPASDPLIDEFNQRFKK